MDHDKICVDLICKDIKAYENIDYQKCEFIVLRSTWLQHLLVLPPSSPWTLPALELRKDYLEIQNIPRIGEACWPLFRAHNFPQTFQSLYSSQTFRKFEIFWSSSVKWFRFSLKVPQTVTGASWYDHPPNAVVPLLFTPSLFSLSVW